MTRHSAPKRSPRRDAPGGCRCYSDNQNRTVASQRQRSLAGPLVTKGRLWGALRYRGRSDSAGWAASGGELFTAEKFPKRAGGCGPRTPFGCAACIPGSGIARAAALLRAVPSAAPYPFHASRGTVESDNRYGYTTFLKGRTGCHRARQAAAHGSFCVRIPRPYERTRLLCVS